MSENNEESVDNEVKSENYETIRITIKLMLGLNINQFKDILEENDLLSGFSQSIRSTGPNIGEIEIIFFDDNVSRVIYRVDTRIIEIEAPNNSLPAFSRNIINILREIMVDTNILWYELNRQFILDGDLTQNLKENMSWAHTDKVNDIFSETFLNYGLVLANTNNPANVNLFEVTFRPLSVKSEEYFVFNIIRRTPDYESFLNFVENLESNIDDIETLIGG